MAVIESARSEPAATATLESSASGAPVIMDSRFERVVAIEVNSPIASPGNR